jgi:hypothetical protein
MLALLLGNSCLVAAAGWACGSSIHYGRSELLDIMFDIELARRLSGSAVTGQIPRRRLTPPALAVNYPSPARWEGRSRGSDSATSPESSRSASTPAFVGRSSYYTVRGSRQIQAAPPGGDATLRSELWSHTERLLSPWI